MEASRISILFRFPGYTSVKQLALISVLVLQSGWLWSQHVTISGLCHRWYAGKVVRVSTAADYVTNLMKVEDTDTISADGRFELLLHTGYTRPVQIEVGNVISELYVEPQGTYSITLAEPSEEVNIVKDVQHTIVPGIVTADSAELNVLIFDFKRIFNGIFVSADERFLSRAVMFRRADSLQKICDVRYRGVQHSFFRSYVTYAIASVNASLSRGEDFLAGAYILNRPLQYRHSEYMKFFNSLFRGYIKAAASRKKGQSLYHIINVAADPGLLSQSLKEEKLMQNDSLRELVMISNLWDFYFSAEFISDAVKAMISKINLTTSIKQHREITASMLTFLNKMQEGSAAPDFSARTREGKTGSLGSFKGRWVYLNFFSVKNSESLKEMPKIAALNRKYAGKVVFLSICVDDSLSDYLKYLRANPKFNWPIWHNYHPSMLQTARDKYHVTGTEAYFLISNEGYLAQSPALSPSKGIEYRFNIIFRVKEKRTKTGIR